MDILLLSVLSFIPRVLGSGVVFDATPPAIQPPLSDSVSLRCSLKDSSPSAPGAIVGRSLTSSDVTDRRVATDTTDIEYVTSMVISKNGADVATLTEHIPAKAFSNYSDVTVTGSLARSQGEKGFLQVDVHFPRQQESGEYMCEVTGVDDKGHSYDFTQSLEVTTQDITLDDVVQNLVSLKKENHLLKEMLNTKVLFSVGVTSHAVVSAGQAVIYDKVFSNIGGGYDVSTGLFTCPVTGHYHLEVNGLSQAGLNFFFEIQQNNHAVVAVYGSAGHSHQGSSNSVVIKLSKGDVVRVASMNSSGSSIYGTPSLIYSTFTGELVALDNNY